MPEFRTDKNNNPTAFTVSLARQANLVQGTDYTIGDPFKVGEETYYTARLVGDPIEVTTRLIDKLGFYTALGQQRWIYIGIPKFVWDALDDLTKKGVIGFMYHHEGGTELKSLFE